VGALNSYMELNSITHCESKVLLSDGGGCSEFPNTNGYHVEQREWVLWVPQSYWTSCWVMGVGDCVWQCVCCVCCVLFSVLFLLCVLYVVCCVVLLLCLWLFIFILAEFVVYLVLLLYYFVFSEYKEQQRNTTQNNHMLYVWCFFYVLWLFSFLIVLLFLDCLFYVGECEDIASNTVDTTHKANNNQWFCKDLSNLCCIW
jgi:hypothetical protein